MKIGAHQSIAGGYDMAVERIAEKGGNALQIFSSSPRVWQKSKIDDEQIELFHGVKQRLSIEHVYFHASYLINLANNSRGGMASVNTLVHELNLASQLGIVGSIIHLGSFANGDYDTLITNIKAVLKTTPENTQFIIENAGTRKIGQTLDEIYSIVKDVGSDRIRVCLDTCHLHAAGYDLSTQQSFERFFTEFDEKIGIENIAVVHVNDSRDPFGSNRDRHENIGQGKIPDEVFRLLVNHPDTKDFPFILETPGFDKKGPDKQNIDIVKSFIKKA